MVRVIVESSYDPALDDASERHVNAQLKSQLACRNVRWLRVLLSLDRRRVISELEAADAESVRELYRIAGVAFDRVWTAHVQEQTPQDCEEDGLAKRQCSVSNRTQPDRAASQAGDRPIWFWFYHVQAMSSHCFPML